MKDLLHEDWRPYGGKAPSLDTIQPKLVAAQAPNEFLERLSKVFKAAGPDPLNEGGTWLTRVKKHYFKAHKEEIGDKFTQILGNAIVPALEARFSTVFDWKAGDYGDGGSCYFAFNAATRHWFQESGVHVMLLRRNGRGYGRVWLWPRENYMLAWGGQGARAAVHMADFMRCNGLTAEERYYSFDPSGSSLYDTYNSMVVFKGDKKPPEAEPASMKQHGFPYPTCAKCGKKDLHSFWREEDGSYYCRSGYSEKVCKP